MAVVKKPTTKTGQEAQIRAGNTFAPTSSPSSGGSSSGSSSSGGGKQLSATQQSSALTGLGNASSSQLQTYTQKMASAGYNTSFLSGLNKPTTTAVKQSTGFSGGDPYYQDTPNNPAYVAKPVNFGALGNAKSATKYDGQGVQISDGGVMKDLTKFQGLDKNNSFDLFGAKAQEAEKLNPGFIQKRNDVYAMDIRKLNPTISQDNVDQTIIDYLKAKDPNGTLGTGDRGNLDVQNTVQAIKNQLGTIPTAQELQVQGLTERATDAYDREAKNIESKYNAEKNTFIKQGAIEDRFTNFNEVNDNINNVLQVAGQHRADNLYTGMPNDQQISEIATKAGQSFATTKKILEGRGFEDLQLQDEFAKKSSEGYDRQLQDQETNRQRAITDAETQHIRTQTALNEQIDDVITQMESTLGIGEKQGALSGAGRNDGYIQGLNSIRDAAIKNTNRLELRKDRDTENTALNKARITENYGINTTRIKTDLENSLNNIKTTVGSELSTYMNTYMPSSSELTRKLDELDSRFGNESQLAFNNYLKNLQGITDTMTYDTEKALKLDQLKQNLQQTNITNLMANNGAALAGINFSDLKSMLQSGDISPVDYTSMVGYMKTLGLSSLQSLGTPTSEDISLYNSLLAQDVSPQEALSTVISKNPSRFQGTKGGSDWKYDENTGKYMRTSAQGNLEFTDDPTSNVTTSSNVPNTYTAANNSQKAEGDVFLNKYKEGDKAPRDGYCGQFVNDYLKNMGITNQNLFLDPILDKSKYVNSQTPTKGSVMIMDSKSKPENGHVAIIESINSDGTVNLKEANRNGDKSVHVRKNVDVSNMGVKVYGYFDPSIAPIQSSSSNSSEKDTYLALVKKGGLTKNDQEKIAKKAIKQGWSTEFNEALNQGAIIDLSPAQQTQYNKEYDRFIGNQVVKGFEEGLTQFESLGYSLSDKSGPGDMAGVFSFMKTLDSTSVVRETEFNEAAKSAGVFERASNIYANLTQGKILTADQAATFKKIASKFIISKGESYDRLYLNMKNAYKQFGIPDALLPIKATDQLKSFIDSGSGSGSSTTSSGTNNNVQKVQGGRGL